MEKQRAIVDSCFLQKIAAEGKCAENIKKIIDNSDYIPVTHRYVADYEFGLHRYLSELIEEKYITVVEYNEFLEDELSRDIYEAQFYSIYNEMRDYLQNYGTKKQMPELSIPKGHSIFTHHLQGSSMGDVHMILMASFMRLPVILSEDSDIPLLRDIAKRRLSVSNYQLKIYNTSDLLGEIASKPSIKLTHKEFENIVKQVGERGNWKEINAIWNSNHSNNV